MAGYLIAVTGKRGGTGTAFVILLGVADGMFADQPTAQAAAADTVTTYLTNKDGSAPTNVATLVNQTR